MNNLKVTRKLIFTLMLGMFLISMVSGYDPHKQSTDFDLVISSNNATACNLTYVQSPNNTKVIYNVALDKDGQTFAKNVTSNNFTDIGDTCMGITCYDGVGYEVGSVCFGKLLWARTFFCSIYSLCCITWNINLYFICKLLDYGASSCIK